MTLPLRLTKSRGLDGVSGTTCMYPTGASGLTRLLQVALALYLTPVLLIVLFVGLAGMLVLTIARVVIGFVRGPESWPHVPVGPSSLQPCDSDFEEGQS